MGHVAVGGAVALALVSTSFFSSRLARARRARVRERLKTEPGYREESRRRSDRITRIFGWYLAGLSAFVALTVIAWVIARLA